MDGSTKTPLLVANFHQQKYSSTMNNRVCPQIYILKHILRLCTYKHTYVRMYVDLYVKPGDCRLPLLNANTAEAS